jgi:hypothetical protein
MTQLEPCPRCERHVRIHEAACPFCGESLAGFSPRSARALPKARLGRAALFAFGVSAAASTLTGCGDDSDDDEQTADGGGGDGNSNGSTGGDDGGGTSGDSGGPVALYGAPASDGGVDNQSDEDAGFIALYGGAPSGQG